MHTYCLNQSGHFSDSNFQFYECINTIGQCIVNRFGSVSGWDIKLNSKKILCDCMPCIGKLGLMQQKVFIGTRIQRKSNMSYKKSPYNFPLAVYRLYVRPMQLTNAELMSSIMPIRCCCCRTLAWSCGCSSRVTEAAVTRSIFFIHADKAVSPHRGVYEDGCYNIYTHI